MSAREILEREQASDTDDYRLYEMVREIVSPYEGARITKRIRSAVRSAHPNWQVLYSTDYGMFSLRIWGGDTRRDYDNGLVFWLGYNHGDDASTINMKRFDESNARYGQAALDRIAQRAALLANDFPERIDAAAQQLRDARAAFAALQNAAHTVLRELVE